MRADKDVESGDVGEYRSVGLVLAGQVSGGAHCRVLSWASVWPVRP